MIGALQQSVYTVLTASVGSPALPVLSCSVYDAVPTDASFPYVTIGEATAVPFDTDNSVGLETTITVHVWSRYSGYAETKAIQRQIYNALHRQEFAVMGFDLVGSTFEFSESFIDADGLTRHGVCRFRVILEQQS